ncbi:unnamed protein product [Allacma fusca]|uniref:Uncharacterized protein n=1 Tax=Allacma fusca TaxID=39272 RepID=A0A8J2KDE1_9HEXA|nr:unnamed protein product [Allacma fusca]
MKNSMKLNHHKNDKEKLVIRRGEKLPDLPHHNAGRSGGSTGEKHTPSDRRNARETPVAVWGERQTPSDRVRVRTRILSEVIRGLPGRYGLPRIKLIPNGGNVYVDVEKVSEKDSHRNLAATVAVVTDKRVDFLGNHKATIYLSVLSEIKRTDPRQSIYWIGARKSTLFTAESLQELHYSWSCDIRRSKKFGSKHR